MIGVVQQGTQEFGVHGVAHVAGPGAVLFLNPDEIHNARATGDAGVVYQTIHVPEAIVEKISGATIRFRQPVVQDPAAALALCRALAAFDAACGAGSAAACLSEILEIAVGMQPSLIALTHPTPDLRLLALRQYVDRNLDATLSLRMLAGRLDMSPQNLIRCFRRSLGVTPQDFVRARRTSMAKRMLEAASPTDVAACTGFVDQSHLTRWMKACYGTTPGAYRRMLHVPTLKFPRTAWQPSSHGHAVMPV